MTGGPPDRLNERHCQIAGLDAAGYTNVEIARMLGANANRISIVRQSPLYQALLSVEKRKLADRLRDSHTARIESLADLAFAAKERLLTQDCNLSVLNAASDSILDRLVPRKTEREERREVVVHLTVDDDARIRRTLAEDPEDGTLDISPPAASRAFASHAALTPLGVAVMADRIAEATADPADDEASEGEDAVAS